MTEVQLDYSQFFESKRLGGLTPEEIKDLRELFRKLSKEEQDKFLNEYKDLSKLKKPEESFIESLKLDLKNLRQNIEIGKTPNTYKELQEIFKDNEAMKDLLDIFGNYIDLKLHNSFSPNEKELIKLAIFGEIQKSLNTTDIVNNITNQILSPVKKLIDSFNGEKTTEKGDFSKKLNDIKVAFERIGISSIIDIVDERIEKINVSKNQDKKIDNLEDVLKITNPEAKNITKESIKKDAVELAEKLKTGRDFGENIKAGLDGLPMGLGETITGWLKDLAKEYPIVGFFLSLFFGKDFLNEGLAKINKSIKKLEEFSKTSKFPLKGIKPEELKDLDSKKLEKFYKYLDSKEIDYSSDTFWEELLTGKSENEKVKKVYKLLTQDGKFKGILQGDELKGNILDNFIGKLNGLEEVEEDKEQTDNKILQIKNENEVIGSKIFTFNGENGGEGKMPTIQEMKDQIDLARETMKKGNFSEEQKSKQLAEFDKIIDSNSDLKKLYENEVKKLELEQEKDFKNSVLKISTLPAEIIYKGNKLNLNINQQKNIVLGDKIFGIEVNTEYGDKFKNIEFKDGDFYINGDTKITKEQVKDLISSLMDKNTFSYKGKVQKPIIGDVDYEIIIQRI